MSGSDALAVRPIAHERLLYAKAWASSQRCEGEGRSARRLKNRLNGAQGRIRTSDTAIFSRSNEPTTPADKLEYRALAEIEQLGGFAPQQQAAE